MRMVKGTSRSAYGAALSLASASASVTLTSYRSVHNGPVSEEMPSVTHENPS
jgi:hypothetical protein